MKIQPIRTAKIYLAKKKKETALKHYDESVNQIVKGILLDKSAKQAIEMLNDIILRTDLKLDEKLRESLETVECVTKYKKLK